VALASQSKDWPLHKSKARIKKPVRLGEGRVVPCPYGAETARCLAVPAGEAGFEGIDHRGGGWLGSLDDAADSGIVRRARLRADCGDGHAVLAGF